MKLVIELIKYLYRKLFLYNKYLNSSIHEVERCRRKGKNKIKKFVDFLRGNFTCKWVKIKYYYSNVL